jgi:hypothetical protein
VFPLGRGNPGLKTTCVPFELEIVLKGIPTPTKLGAGTTSKDFSEFLSHSCSLYKATGPIVTGGNLIGI